MCSTETPVALITGAAKRIGAGIARHLHANHYRVIVHYARSAADAQTLVDALNNIRPDSAIALSADICDLNELEQLVRDAAQAWGRLDAVVNNASTFYPTPLESLSEHQFDDLIGTNLKAPLFLAKASRTHLEKTHGSLLNLIDIHAEHPRAPFNAYCAAKAGLHALTRELAVELAPHIRVNGISPGAMLPPPDFKGDISTWEAEVSQAIPAGRVGRVEDIAATVGFLLSESARYITGQIIAVDGAKSRA